MTASGDTLFLVDISSFIFRAFYAIRSLNSPAGVPVNSVYGVVTMLLKLVEEEKPGHLAIAYDSKEPSFRKQLFEAYKANRSAPPEELVPQFDLVEKAVRSLGFASFRQAGVEADDLIATATRLWKEASPRNRVVVVTGDKDLMALVDDRVEVWDTMASKRYGREGVIEKFGVEPAQIVDYLAIVGDTSDNIPGVAGIGPKGAVDLLKAHRTLEGVLEAAESGKIPGKKGQALTRQKEIARLSRQLATLKEDCPLELSGSGWALPPTLPGEVALHFFQELGFHSLVRKYGGETSPVSEAPSSQGKGKDSRTSPSETFRCIQTRAAFQEALAACRKAGEFGFDLETTSTNPREAELVGVSLCWDRSFGVYIPVGHRGTEAPQLPVGEVLEGLRPLLEDPRYKKIGQNLKYDWSVLEALGVRPDGIGADTMVAAYVLNPEAGRYNLEALAEAYLGYQTLTYEEVCGKGADAIGFDQVPVDLATRYSAEDAWVAVRLWDVLRERLNAEGLMPVFAEIDLPLVPVLARMEGAGIRVDVPYLQQLGAEFGRELREIEAKIATFTNGPINLNSTRQLAHLLFDELKLPPQSRTKTGYSTDASVLEALAPLHEVPQLLLEYREITKLKGTYVDPLPGQRDRKTGRIHTSFRQTGTATGRLSSSDPNLQNIPIRSERGVRIRRAFIPSEGNVLLAADYSQIELRLLAHLSGDPDLVASFKSGEDVHRRTASEIFGIPKEAVDDRSRSIAKAINFGLMYGKTAFGLSQELKIPRKEAQETIDRYFTRYAGVKRFLDQQIEQAREKGYTETLLGRRRPLADIRSKNAAVRANAERIAMNAPIQGTAADLMKIAMVLIDEALRSRFPEAKLLIQVHDEVVLDVPAELGKEVERMVVEKMEKALTLSVPLVVNSAIGANWEEI